MIQSFKDRVGIDRTVITSFEVVSIDTHKLAEATAELDGGLTTTEGFSGLQCKDSTTGELLNIGRLWVKSSDVGFLDCSWSLDTLHHRRYNNTSLAINTSDDGNNLQNLSADEYRRRVAEVVQTLRSKYGITITYDKAMLRSIEVNVTIKLDHDFYKYERVLNRTRLNVPVGIYGRGGKIKTEVFLMNNGERDELETWYAWNDTLTLKVYNKIRQLLDTGIFVGGETNVMRIEYTFKGDAIITAFGSRYLTDINNEGIAAMFLRYFNRDIVNPWYRWHKQNQKDLGELLRTYVESDRRYYLNDFIRECRKINEDTKHPFLFDIEDIREALRIVFGTHGLAKRYFKIKSKLTHEDDLFGNIDKMTEVINKVRSACNRIPKGIPTDGEQGSNNDDVVILNLKSAEEELDFLFP